MLDVKLRASERRLVVFSTEPRISHGHPFAAALEAEGAGAEEVAKRVIRNQALVRGSPIAGRALVSAGTAVVAYGVSRRSPPGKKFSLMTKKDFRQQQRYTRGSKSAKYYTRAVEKKTVFRRTGFGVPQVDIQERRVRVANQRRIVRNRRVITGAGTLMTVGGKALPTLAYGYIGYDMLRRHSSGQKVDVQSELETATFGMTTGEMLSSAADLYSQAEMAYQVSKVVYDIGISYL